MAKSKAKRASNSVYVHPTGKTYLSFQEVSRRAQVRPQTVKSWVERGQLRTFEVLGRQMVMESDLMSFLEPTPLEPGVVLKGKSSPRDAQKRHASLNGA